MVMDTHSVGVIGAGAWGTALAIIFNRAGAKVTLWSRSRSLRESMLETRMNARHLPDVFISPAIDITSEIAEAAKADVLVLAVPAQVVRPVCITLADMIDMHVPLVVASKGIERGSLLLLSEVLEAMLPSNPVVILSGPNFAREAALGKPTATTLASRHPNLLTRLQFTFGGRTFRPYITDDVISVQVGGAVKNVIALACGIAIGAELGENARAAIMTRGLAEMKRLAEAKGGRAETLSGLSGIGDLMLSCASEQSRNMAFGVKVGKASITESDAEVVPSGLAEGVMTAEAVYDLSQKLGIPMPICVSVADILKGRVTVQEGIEGLLMRPLARE
jgi:glycerol-3-phosphate dehydrogenase (NAD(P)+)